jgi:3',5'-cyclic AMP phosphodiesterase CpdA
MKIGHISDIHVLELRDIRPWQFFNKRVTGGLNLLVDRGDRHSAEVVHTALEHLEEAGVDHIAVTGDVTNLAIESEFAAVARIFAQISGSPEAVSVVPGNHDYYVRDSVERRLFETYLADYIRSDLPEYQLDTGYPFCKLLGEEVALIGMNSGVVSPPMFAIGTVDDDELERTEDLLDDPRVRDRFTIVMIHHPVLPFEHATVRFMRRLTNAERVLRRLRIHQVDLLIHGHNHHFGTYEVPHLRGSGTMRICEAGSSSVTTYEGDEAFGGKFNIYHIEDGHLHRIETHLFEASESSFLPWRENVYTVDLED